MASEVQPERDVSGRVHVRGGSMGMGDTGTSPDPRAEEVVELRDQVSTDIPGPVSDICTRLFGDEGIEAQRKFLKDLIEERERIAALREKERSGNSVTSQDVAPSSAPAVPTPTGGVYDAAYLTFPGF